MKYFQFRHRTQIRISIVPFPSESAPVTFIQEAGQIGKELESLETSMWHLLFILPPSKNSQIHVTFDFVSGNAAALKYNPV